MASYPPQSSFIYNSSSRMTSTSNNRSRSSSSRVAMPVLALSSASSSSSLRTPSSPLLCRRLAITGTLLLFGSPKHNNIIIANSGNACFQLVEHSSGSYRNTGRRRPCPAAASAATVDAAIAEQTTTTTTVPAAADDTTSTIISLLLFIAFVGLTALTIGVIYIAVTDFLQKREGEKFQKEEAAKKKKQQGGGKKRQQQVKARAAGPKGFGQKLSQLDEDDITLDQ